MLQPGQNAPEFVLHDADMQAVSLAQFRGKLVLLFFYPRDGTPGCTLQATEFSDHEDQFDRCDCVILGVSRDDCLTHAEFRDKNGLSIRLLADPDGEVCRLYEVLQAKEHEGVPRECVVRSTFLVDRNGVIRHAAYGVNPKHHASEMLELVRRMKNGKNDKRRPAPSAKAHV